MTVYILAAVSWLLLIIVLVALVKFTPSQRHRDDDPPA